MLNGSRLYYKAITCEKNSSFCSVLQGNPTVASPKEQLYEQMTSNPGFTEREIHKKPTLISYNLVRSKNRWSRITLLGTCTYVFGLSTL